MQQQVRLVFLGETLQGFDAKQVQRRMGRELGLDKARLARLFSGRRIVIKRAVDAERAFRHVDRFARVGARLRIEMLDSQGDPEPEAGPGSSHDPAMAMPSEAPAPAAPTAAPFPAPPLPRRSSRGSRRSSRSRRRARWVAALAFLGLLVAVGALAAFVLLPSDLLHPGPAARPAAAARAVSAAPRTPQPDTAAAAAKAWPQLTGPAAQIYRDLYQPARGHKAFAAAPDGRWGWTGDAGSAAAAVDAARAACEVGRLPEAPRCEVLSVDGEDPPRVPPPSSPSSAPR